MMTFFNLNYFGTITGMVASTILIIFQIVLKIDLTFEHELGKLPLLIWLTLYLIFLLSAIALKKVIRLHFNYAFLTLVFVSLIYLSSYFQWMVACCPEDYESMTDWNAAQNMFWMISFPLTFAIVLLQGFVYDLVFVFFKTNWNEN